MKKVGSKIWYFKYDAKVNRLLIEENKMRSKISNDLLIILTERIMFADDDRKHRPFCVMESAG